MYIGKFHWRSYRVKGRENCWRQAHPLIAPSLCLWKHLCQKGGTLPSIHSSLRGVSLAPGPGRLILLLLLLLSLLLLRRHHLHRWEGSMAGISVGMPSA